MALLDTTAKAHGRRAAAWIMTMAMLVAAGCSESDDAGAGDGDESASIQPVASNQADAASAKPVAAPNRAVATQPTGDAPPVQFEPDVYDFGIIDPGFEVQTTVQVRNIGSSPLKISRVRPDCKCTSLNETELVGAVIPPGGSVPMHVRIEQRSSPGPRRTNIRFEFDGYSGFPEVRFQGEIALPVRAAPAYITGLSDKPQSGQVRVESQDGQPFRILGAGSLPPVYADGFDPDLDEPRSAYMLQYDLDQYTCDEMPKWWVVETDRADCPLLDLEIRHTCTTWIDHWKQNRAWRLALSRLVVGEIEPGGSAEIDVRVEDLGNDRVFTIESASPNFNVEVVSYTPTSGVEGSLKLRVVPRADHRGLVYGFCRVWSSSTYTPVVVIGRVPG